MEKKGRGERYNLDAEDRRKEKRCMRKTTFRPIYI
jgi:hypothetical protein